MAIFGLGRDKRERLERELESLREGNKGYELESRAYQEIKIPRSSLGSSRTSFLSSMGRGGRPTEFYRAFVYDMDKAQGEEEEKKTLTEYVRKMVYGGMGYTTPAAIKKLQEKWRAYQEGIGGMQNV